MSDQKESCPTCGAPAEASEKLCGHSDCDPQVVVSTIWRYAPPLSVPPETHRELANQIAAHFGETVTGISAWELATWLLPKLRVPAPPPAGPWRVTVAWEGAWFVRGMIRSDPFLFTDQSDAEIVCGALNREFQRDMVNRVVGRDGETSPHQEKS